VDIASDKAPAARRGRRPAGSGTREAIIEAARGQFGTLGYRRTTLREIARIAGVDPRLVLHYFGSKKQLFMESVQLPIDSQAGLERLFAPGAEGIGERAAQLLVGVLEDAATQQALVSLVRAAASEPEAAELIRELLTERLLTPLAKRVSRDRPELRASLMGSQVVGLAMARHVIGLGPLASASREELISALAPVFEHYLIGAWTDDSG
jgi:AcrR family transcriptional regulator